LWDVTDGDIDRLTVALVRNMMPTGDDAAAYATPNDGCKSLSCALLSAGSVCRLLNLTASAVVMTAV
jgi:hypothetical protein